MTTAEFEFVFRTSFYTSKTVISFILKGWGELYGGQG